ncbi:hypothetical protein C723_2313 [Christiangramia flava JLT2011]|uniref:Uncharacterized protein n=1 Tax=Christiangramia flava JLT2011 TaxID=1229726 RepID=A0A1L7I6E9_9FLAO|nr:hypothetical protein GRFL_2454 [Christiangramia flava JLT2011]OSS38922.1 hypothetical protein C723_2313 [Christiangramia flava JLT2011]
MLHGHELRAAKILLFWRISEGLRKTFPCKRQPFLNQDSAKKRNL